MATNKQTQAAKHNVKKAQEAAADQKTIASMPKKTRTALGKQGAAVAQRKRTGGATPKTRTDSMRSPKSVTSLAGRRWAGTSLPGSSVRSSTSESEP